MTIEASTTTPTLLLIDGDVVAFKAAAACEYVQEDWTYKWLTKTANLNLGEAIVDNIITGLKASFQTNSIKVFLSDRENNWRKLIYPDYKANRSNSQRPLALDHLKDYILEQYETTVEPWLEADDLLGIAATAPDTKLSGELRPIRVICGVDKDFKTIPAYQHTLGDYINGDTSKPRISGITPQLADQWHMRQTLSGDAVDNYPGCPGIGVARADAIVEDPQLLVPQSGKITRGPRKGQSTTAWKAQPTRNLEAAVQSNFAKAGTPETFLTMARIARILRHGEYSFGDKKVKLWSPHGTPFSSLEYLQLPMKGDGDE